jgi:hypothetical protein
VRCIIFGPDVHFPCLHTFLSIFSSVAGIARSLPLWCKHHGVDLISVWMRGWAVGTFARALWQSHVITTSQLFICDPAGRITNCTPAVLFNNRIIRQSFELMFCHQLNLALVIRLPLRP